MTTARTIDCHTHVLTEEAMRLLAKQSPKVAPKLTNIDARGGTLDAVPALADFVFGRLTGRRIDLAELVNDKAALAAYVRDNVAGTFHVCGTCRMGKADDPDVVVDNSGRLRGVSGLRVVDASIIPAVPRGNTNIPTIMLAEKIAADMCGERTRGA